MKDLLPLLLLLLSAGCFGPEDSIASQLPDDHREAGPEHRPGQPCLVCHSSPLSKSGLNMLIAGTVYGSISAGEGAGLANVTVTIADSAGHQLTALTNPAGTFYVTSGSDEEDRGHVTVPWDPIFPLHASVTLNGVTKVMQSEIGRDGSCASCHGPEPSATSIGRVYVSAP
jgi:hypothetical protein